MVTMGRSLMLRTQGCGSAHLVMMLLLLCRRVRIFFFLRKAERECLIVISKLYLSFSVAIHLSNPCFCDITRW